MKVSTGGKELKATSPRAERQKRLDSATDGYSPDEVFLNNAHVGVIFFGG